MGSGLYGRRGIVVIIMRTASANSACTEGLVG
jgi:hypothetical protein